MSLRQRRERGRGQLNMNILGSVLGSFEISSSYGVAFQLP